MGSRSWEQWDVNCCPSVSVLQQGGTSCSNMLDPSRCQGWTDQEEEEKNYRAISPDLEFSPKVSPNAVGLRELFCAGCESSPWKNSKAYNSVWSQRKSTDSFHTRSVCRDSQSEDKWGGPGSPQQQPQLNQGACQGWGWLSEATVQRASVWEPSGSSSPPLLRIPPSWHTSGLSLARPNTESYYWFFHFKVTKYPANPI